MTDKLTGIEERYAAIEKKLADPDLYADPAEAARLLKEQKELTPIVEACRAYRRAEASLEESRELASSGDEELRLLAEEEGAAAREEMQRLEEELRRLLLPKDPNDERNVIVEIRGGVGGEEAALFAADLYRMYTMYAERRGWRIEVLNLNETEIGGIKEISFLVNGQGAFSRLKF